MIDNQLLIKTQLFYLDKKSSNLDKNRGKKLDRSIDKKLFNSNKTLTKKTQDLKYNISRRFLIKDFLTYQVIKEKN